MVRRCHHMAQYNNTIIYSLIIKAKQSLIDCSIQVLSSVLDLNSIL